MPDNYYSIYEVSRRSGVPKSTLQEWVRKGHVKPAEVFIDGHRTCRLFSENAIFRTRRIRFRREEGDSLPEAARDAKNMARFIGDRFPPVKNYLDLFRRNQPRHYYTLPFVAWLTGLERETLAAWVERNLVDVQEIFYNESRNGHVRLAYFNEDNLHAVRMVKAFQQNGMPLETAVQLKRIVY